MARPRRHTVSSDLFLICTSLMIASVVWVIAKGGNLGPVRFTLPIQLKNVPANFDATLAPDSSEGVIEVTLPNSLHSQVQPGHFTIEVDWSKVRRIDPEKWCGIDKRNESAPVEIGSENVRLSSNVPESLRRRLQEHSLQMTLVEPEVVVVEARYYTRKAKVQFRTTGKPAEGFRLAAPVAPEVVKDTLVTAAPEVLAALDPDGDGYIPVPSDEISLAGKKETFQRDVGLNLPDGLQLVHAEDGKISVPIRIEPVTSMRQVTGVPIVIHSPEENLAVAYTPQEAAVKIEGPEAKVQRISPTQLVVRPAEILQGYDGLETVVPLRPGFGDDVPPDLRDGIKVLSVSPTTATAKFRESSGGYTWHGKKK